MLRMSDAADIAELLPAGFARASRPTKVVLQKSSATLTLPSKMLPMLFLMNDKEAADTAEWDCCSVCSRKQTNKCRAAEELSKTADAAAQRLVVDAAFEDYKGAAVFIAEKTDGDMDQVHGGRTKMVHV